VNEYVISYSYVVRGEDRFIGASIRPTCLRLELFHRFHTAFFFGIVNGVDRVLSANWMFACEFVLRGGMSKVDWFIA